ncbi:Solute carrier family 22 member 7 [Holothuria leucospilota]|uniref:Solute carrier family 22 member 7 n=1 Tax=Holothuria leucospilota TaxID=206669 RepID=A0A9Q1BIH2_HOLLE|nr:Solute carrier family 22 member 7 [Holothuria leucospilota]
MHYDDILHQIGEFGPYQKVIFLLVTVCSLFSPINVVSQAFLAGNVDHWCGVSAWTDCDCTVEPLNAPEVSWCSELKKNLSIPWTDQQGFDQCYKYDLPQEWIGNCSMIVEVETFNVSGRVPCDEGWVYDRTQYKTTITSDVSGFAH